MSSAGERNDLSGKDQNSMQSTNPVQQSTVLFTSQVQQSTVLSTSQIEQPTAQTVQPAQFFYWNPNVNYMSTQWYYQFTPSGVYRVPITTWMPISAQQPAPYYQTYQPYRQQLVPQVLLLAPSPVTNTHLSTVNSQNLNVDPRHTANPSSTCETRQDFMPTSLSDQVLECYSLTETSAGVGTENTVDDVTYMTSASLPSLQPKPNESQSSHDNPYCTSNVLLTCETQLSGPSVASPMQNNQVSEFSLLRETLLGMNSGNSINITCSSSASTLPPRSEAEVHLSPQDNLDYTPNASSTSEIQLSQKDAIATTLGDQVSKCDSLPETSSKINKENIAESQTRITSASSSSPPSKTDMHLSLPDDVARTIRPSPSSVTQSCEQDLLSSSSSNQVWERDSVLEMSSEEKKKENTGSIADDQTPMTSASPPVPPSKTDVRPSPCSPNVSSTGDTQLGPQDLSSRPRRTRRNKRRLISSSSSEPEKPRKRKYIMCQCPNCRAKDGNKKRYPYGALKHVCHIPDCGRIFDRPSILKQHLLDWHSAKANFWCRYCDKGFACKLELRQHVKSHKNRCQCPNCSARGGNTTSGPNGRRLHVCHVTDCGRVFDRPLSLKKHLDWHGGKKEFSCLYCNEGFSRKSALREHVKKSHKKPKLYDCECPNCSTEGGNQVRDRKGALQHACHVPDCGKVFGRPSALKLHLEVHSGRKSFACPYCDKKFSRKVVFYEHRKSHMRPKQSDCRCPNCSAEKGNEIRGPDGSMKHVCHIADCGRLFNRPSYLRTHLELRSVEKHFVCRYCNEGFSRKFLLREHHVKLHKNHKNSEPSDCQCPNCSVEGGNKTKGPNGRQLHVCRVADCGKFFSYIWALRRHLKRHSDKGFGSKAVLNCDVELTSRKVDTENSLEKDKPKHACHVDGCGKVYSTIWNLKVHLKSHYGTTPYVCKRPSCGRVFTHKFYLQRHELTHTARKNILCSQCHQKFRYNRHLMDHVKTMHENLGACMI